MAQLLAVVATAFECASADPGAEVLSFDVSRPRESLLALCRLPLGGLLLAWAAVLSASVAATAEDCLASLEAQRALYLSLVAERGGCGSSTSASHINILDAGWAISKMAFSIAEMTTFQQLLTGLVAMWDRILARGSWLINELLQRRLSTRAVGNNVG
jgi:hypothetical protein